MIRDLFATELCVISVGLPTFPEDLRRQGIRVVEVEWRPPAGGNAKILALLDRIRRAAPR